MLVIVKLAEAAEGVRKGLRDDKLPHRSLEEVEMADAVFRLLDFAGGFSVECDAASTVHLSEESPCPADKLEGLFEIAKTVALSTSYPPLVWIALVEIQSYCKKHGLDLWAAFDEKLACNAVREDPTHEVRRAEGGRKLGTLLVAASRSTGDKAT